MTRRIPDGFTAIQNPQLDPDQEKFFQNVSVSRPQFIATVETDILFVATETDAWIGLDHDGTDYFFESDTIIPEINRMTTDKVILKDFEGAIIGHYERNYNEHKKFKQEIIFHPKETK